MFISIADGVDFSRYDDVNFDHLDKMVSYIKGLFIGFWFFFFTDFKIHCKSKWKKTAKKFLKK